MSWVFLHLFHPEPIDMREDPFSEPDVDPAREPFDANQAIPTLLFGRYRKDFVQKISGFEHYFFEISGSICIPSFGRIPQMVSDTSQIYPRFIRNRKKYTPRIRTFNGVSSFLCY